VSKTEFARGKPHVHVGPMAPEAQEAVQEPARMPARMMYGGEGAPTLEHLLISARNHRQDAEAGRPFVPGTWLLGYRLPDFQRPAVWSEAQQVRFIESAWLGLDLGRVVVTAATGPGWGGPRDRLLIDGQQRFTALSAYFSGTLTVFGETFLTLHPRDRRRFLDITLATTTIDADSVNEDRLKDLYTRLNYGGTPHAPEHHPDASGGPA